MISDHASVEPGYYDIQNPVNGDLEIEYQRLRETLQILQAEPVKNFAAIDALIDQLERLQLAIKGEHGIKGNNPNE